MREIVNLFSERESRDELGIGQVRDTLSDLLWPGTSTLFTRARYFLFIPSCYRAAAETHRDVKKAAALADRNERRLIRGLLDAGEKDGVLREKPLLDVGRMCDRSRRRSLNTH